MLIKRIITSRLCAAVGGHEFRKEWRNLQTKIMFEHYYSFFRYCLFSCRYVMFQKSILSKPKWGNKQWLAGPRPPVPMALPVNKRRLKELDNLFFHIIFKFSNSTHTNGSTIVRNVIQRALKSSKAAPKILLTHSQKFQLNVIFNKISCILYLNTFLCPPLPK